MTTITSTLGEALEALTEDGNTFDLGDGRTLRLRIEPDPDSSINDYDGDGKVSEYFDHRDSHKPRPDGFTGRARKVDVDRSGFVWWEPYDGPMGYVDGDGIQQSATWDNLPASKRAEEYRRIRDLLEYGFSSAGLELLQGTDAYRRPIVVKAAWVGGLEMLSYEGKLHVLKDVFPDLLAELEVELQGGAS